MLAVGTGTRPELIGLPHDDATVLEAPGRCNSLDLQRLLENLRVGSKYLS
jgi:hypothetical protein